VIGARGYTVVVAPDLYDLLRISDRSEQDFKRAVDEYVRRERLDAPEDVPTESIDDGYRQEQIVELDLRAAGITSIVWCTGFGFDFSWIDVPVLRWHGLPAARPWSLSESRFVFPRNALAKPTGFQLSLGPWRAKLSTWRRTSRPAWQSGRPCRSIRQMTHYR